MAIPYRPSVKKNPRNNLKINIFVFFASFILQNAIKKKICLWLELKYMKQTQVEYCKGIEKISYIILLLLNM